MPRTTVTADLLHESLIKTFTEGTVTLPRLRLVKPVPADRFEGDFDATWEDPDVLDRRNGTNV